MDYLKLIIAFERMCESEGIPTTSQLLWYKLVYLNNRCMWRSWFQVDNFRLMSMLGISNEKTLIRARDKLIQFNLIDYKKGKKGCPSSYHINEIYCKKYSINNSINNSINDSISVQENAVYVTAINKHKHKTKTKIKEKNIQKRKFAEFVSMTDDEHSKLVEKYGNGQTKLMIEKLDNYKGSSGKQYKSDYRAILNWVANEVQKGQPVKREYENPEEALMKDDW